MKIIVLSDSHGTKNKIEKLLNNSTYDYLFFLGDGLKDVSFFEDINVKKVCGNCDLWEFSEPITRFENICGIKFMLTHGHNFKAKYLIEPMVQYAKENNAQVLCFGHTHKQKYEIIEGITVINPGAFKNDNYAEIEIDENKNIFVQLKKLQTD